MPVVLFMLWVIFNAKLNWEVALTGLVVATFVYAFMCRHMGYSYKTDLAIIRKLPHGIKYLAVLVWQIALSNLSVSRVVFSRRVEVDPKLVFFKTRLKSDTSLVALANSITLTPGTITVSESDGIFGVHCLNGQMSEGLDESDFVRILLEMEGGEKFD